MPGFCLRCGYSLRRLREHVCPECGRAFDPGDPTTFTIYAPLTPAQQAWLTAGYGLLLAVAVVTVGGALVLNEGLRLTDASCVLMMAVVWRMLPQLYALQLMLAVRHRPPAVEPLVSVVGFLAVLNLAMMGTFLTGSLVPALVASVVLGLSPFYEIPVLMVLAARHDLRT